MIDTGSKGVLAYEELEGLITFQDLKPGSMVSESDLMSITGLGRSPVREAVQRLAQERMVEVHPRRGIVIPLISAEVQLKLLEVRRSVEELAVRLASQRVSGSRKSDLLDLAGVLVEGAGDPDLRLYGRRLKEVHRAIVHSADNEYLHLAMAPLQSISRRFWFASLASRQDPTSDLRLAANLHAATLRSICENDPEEAARCSSALNDYLTEFTYRTLDRQQR